MSDTRVESPSVLRSAASRALVVSGNISLVSSSAACSVRSVRVRAPLEMARSPENARPERSPDASAMAKRVASISTLPLTEYGPSEMISIGTPDFPAQALRRARLEPPTKRSPEKLCLPSAPVLRSPARSSRDPPGRLILKFLTRVMLPARSASISRPPAVSPPIFTCSRLIFVLAVLSPATDCIKPMPSSFNFANDALPCPAPASRSMSSHLDASFRSSRAGDAHVATAEPVIICGSAPALSDSVMLSN